MLEADVEKIKSDEKIWELFTKKEEYDAFFVDSHNRFNYQFSKYRDIFQPRVSEFLLQNDIKSEFFNNDRFSVFLSHDIDQINLSLKYRVFSFLKYGSKKRFREGFERLLKNNIFLNFDEIMSLERKYDAKSTFFIRAPKNPVSSVYVNQVYEAESIANELHKILDNGFEIGLHTGYLSYDSIDDVKYEKKRLEEIINKKIVSCRNHCLRFKVPDTWEVLRKAGFMYDATFGYADCVGFRNGMCHPFRPFNLNTGREIDIVEIPLTIMDTTLFDYMHLDMKYAWKITKLLIDRVEKNNGIISILWHNTTLKEDTKFYEKILRYCSNKGAEMDVDISKI